MININNNSQISQEINLLYILNLIFRNKKLILFATTSFFIVSSFYALGKKRIWEGQFEIVLENNSNSLPTNISSRLASLVGLNTSGSSNSLKTQVAILNSPSVLMPTFDYVNSSKKKISKRNNDLDFYSWKNKLTVSLKEQTSIVAISYKDTEKSLILPVLEQISETYKNYSNINRKKSINLLINFLENQIKFYKDKSKKSINAVQEYAFDQDLGILSLMPSSQSKMSIQESRENATNLGVSYSNLDIEKVRVAAANQIRRIDSQIKKINAFGNDSNDLEYISLTIPDLPLDAIDNIEQLDIELIDLQTKYTNNNPDINALLKKRKILIEALKDKSIKFLKAQRIASEATLESATRPKNVILKYMELLREAKRDESTLIALQQDLRRYKLEEARSNEPWKLITNPTLKRAPVGPKRRQIALIGAFLGFVFSSFVSWYLEKRTKLVFEAKIVEEEFGAKILETFNFENSNLENKLIERFIQDILNLEKLNYYNFLFLGNIDEKFIKQFKSIISNKNIFKDEYLKRLKVNNEINLISDSENEKLILIVSLKTLNYEDMKDLSKRIKLLEKFVFGIVLVN